MEKCSFYHLSLNTQKKLENKRVKLPFYYFQRSLTVKILLTNVETYLYTA